MFKAIFFDNDGILMDTEGLYFEACRDALLEEGIGYTPELYAHYTLHNNLGVLGYLTEKKGYTQKEAMKVRERWLERYFELTQTNTKLFPETMDVLNALKGKYRLGLVTGSRQQEMEVKFRTAPLQHFFEIIAVREDYEQSKPFPDPYLYAAEKLGIDPNECLAIEDSPRGATAAKAAGMTCFIIPNGLTKNLKFPEVDRTLENLSELIPLLLSSRPLD